MFHLVYFDSVDFCFLIVILECFVIAMCFFRFIWCFGDVFRLKKKLEIRFLGSENMSPNFLRKNQSSTGHLPLQVTCCPPLYECVVCIEIGDKSSTINVRKKIDAYLVFQAQICLSLLLRQVCGLDL